MIIKITHARLGTFDMEIDDEDHHLLTGLNLTLNHESNRNTRYAKARIYENCKYVKTIHIHRLIMGLGDFKDDKRIINHIDGNGLNNKKENLEICDAMHNSQSFRCKNKPNGMIYYDTSGKRIKRWRFKITINKKQHSKRFETKEEAEEYRDTYVESFK